MTKIVIASDSFKGSLNSAEVAEAVAEGLRRGFSLLGRELPEIIKVSVADGGEGTARAVTEAMGGRMICAQVSDPLGRPITAAYGLAGPEEAPVALIETASASGLPLLTKEERGPLKTSTFGTGELILDALDRGCRKFMVGLGGSATNDGGMGMLSALGVRFSDKNGAELAGRGCDLEKVYGIDLSNMTPALKEASFTVACDVNTPFCGPGGASEVFAPQKGAGADDVRRLEAGMCHFAGIIKETLGVDISRVKGSGAAGGLGGAFMAFLNGEIRSGVETVLDTIGFNSLLQGASLVITGEGRADFQTPKGKTPAGVLRRAKAMGVPVVLIAGKLNPCPELDAMGFAAMLQTTPAGLPLQEALQKPNAHENIATAICNYIRSTSSPDGPAQGK